MNNLSKGILCLIATIAIPAMVALWARPAQAQGPAVNLTQLAAQVAADHATITALQNTVNAQAAMITALQAKTAPISIQNGVGTNTEMFLTGVNLHVVNGLGATDGNPASPYVPTNTVTNGLGNVIIGYNELRSGNPPIFTPDARTGSHNLILGIENNYTAYAGIVGGAENSISALFGSVIAGGFNTASGPSSVVVSGFDNTASNISSVVSGGQLNQATNQEAVVSGGSDNIASGFNSEVTGGSGNIASGTNSIAP